MNNKVAIFLFFVIFSFYIILFYEAEKILRFSTKHGNEIIFLVSYIIFLLGFFSIIPIYTFVNCLVKKTKNIQKISTAVSIINGSLLLFFIFIILILISDRYLQETIKYLKCLNDRYVFCSQSLSLDIIKSISLLTMLLFTFVYFSYLTIKKVFKTYENNSYVIENVKFYIKINYFYSIIISLTIYGIIFSIPYFYLNLQMNKIILYPSETNKLKKLNIILLFFILLCISIPIIITL